MPYGLDKLWNTEDSIIYSTAEGKGLRLSQSIEENASFLARWAGEVFGEWATWMRHVLPGCTVGFKQSTLRIVQKIKEMHEKNEVELLN